ncbi:MAG TPA: FecR domain-containing protein [Steroidobacteraceae bacterium]|nr:FecR domain-containing protein [Steroidobacteraceae bacterium]
MRTQRAAEWLEILRERDQPDTRAEFMRWITESPLNMDEFLKLDALARETRAVLSSPQFDRQLLMQAAAAQAIPFERMASNTERRSRSGRYRTLWAGIAAACLVVAATLGWWALGEFGGWDTYEAGPSEQRRIDLADGSRVYLNARTRLAVRLGQTQRELRLSSGEALFSVAKDRQRPFRVQTADAIVEAVGTQFNVNARADGTRVAVIEGKVRISGENGSAPDVATRTAALEAGQAARITSHGAIERDRSVNVASIAAWSRPELVFDGTSLEQAVEQFNRYRPAKPLRLEGVQPGSHHYTGLFDATDSEAFAKLLSREEDLLVETGDDEIVIKPRQAD